MLKATLTALSRVGNLKRLNRIFIIMVFLPMCTPCTILAAGIRDRSSELNLYGGSLGGDKTRSTFTVGGSPFVGEIEDGITGGIRAGYNFIPYIGLEAILNFASNDTSGQVLGRPISVKADTAVIGGHINLVIQEG